MTADRFTTHSRVADFFVSIPDPPRTDLRIYGRCLEMGRIDPGLPAGVACPTVDGKKGPDRRPVLSMNLILKQSLGGTPA